MGQVPASRPVSGQSPYGFVGDGRLSRHWRHYFTSLGLPWTLWSRRLARANGVAGRSAAAVLADCPIILLAVSDDAIAPVMATLRAEGLDDRTYVHFCGGRSFEGAFGAHPLMSFANTLYEPAFYRDIPIFVDADRSDPAGYFRSLFPGLPNPCFASYPRRIIENVLESTDGALTGPVARGDAETIRSHLDALEGSALATVYQALIATAGRERP